MGRRIGTGGTRAERPIGPVEFEQLFREHSGTILRFCYRRAEGAASAEDLCSAVFYEAWRRRAEVDLATRPPLPWLYAVATNVVRNERRALRRYQAALRRLPLPAAEPDTSDEIVERVDVRARYGAALERLKELPQPERDVLLLCVGRERSYSAAARELRVPIGTVRSRLNRARARLEAHDESPTPT